MELETSSICALLSKLISVKLVFQQLWQRVSIVFFYQAFYHIILIPEFVHSFCMLYRAFNGNSEAAPNVERREDPGPHVAPQHRYEVCSIDNFNRSF